MVALPVAPVKTRPVEMYLPLWTNILQASGRRLQRRMAFLINGKVSSDGLKAHDDLLADFPFLGPPNP